MARPNLLSVSEVAFIAQVDERTVRRWAKAGKPVEAIRLNGQYFFDAHEFLEYMYKLNRYVPKDGMIQRIVEVTQ